VTEDQPQHVHTVPTELERSDGFIDFAVLFAMILVVWDLALHGVPLWASLPFVIIAAVWTLTGEPAADVPYIGAVAAGIRSKLGLRRAHEWVLAYLWYFRVAVWPEWRTRWQNSRLWCAMAPTWRRWQTLLHASGVLLSSRRVRFWSKR
jgi:hypothetical protein